MTHGIPLFFRADIDRLAAIFWAINYRPRIYSTLIGENVTVNIAAEGQPYRLNISTIPYRVTSANFEAWLVARDKASRSVGWLRHSSWSSIQKVLPCPGVLSTPIRPPIASISPRHRESPRPVPST